MTLIYIIIFMAILWLTIKKLSAHPQSDSNEMPLEITIKYPERRVTPANNPGDPPLTYIGEANPICPYCGVIIKKMPGAKTKCKDCGEFIYVRTRPLDQKKILIRFEQQEAIEEQWAIFNGTYAEWVHDKLVQKARVDSMQNKLQARFGREPSENDIRWGLLNEDLIKNAQSGDWGIYRNTRYEMAIHLFKEAKIKAGIITLAEICYLDLNGPTNLGGQKPTAEYPAWDPSMGDLAPGIINKLIKNCSVLKINPKEFEMLYIENNERIFKNLKLPLSPSKTWDKVAEAMQDET